MPCCGKKRAKARREAEDGRKSKTAEDARLQASLARDPVPSFQYLGKTSLTVIGPRTGRQYRFGRPGAVVTVDPQDRRALSDVSMLRQVRTPADVTQ